MPNGISRFGVDDQLANQRSVHPAVDRRELEPAVLVPDCRTAIVTILGAAGGRSEAQLALGEIGMQTIHFTAGERLAGQLAALGVAA